MPSEERLRIARAVMRAESFEALPRRIRRLIEAIRWHGYLKLLPV